MGPELARHRDWRELGDEICTLVFPDQDPEELKRLFKLHGFTFSLMHEFAHDPPTDAVEHIIKSVFPTKNLPDIISILGNYRNHGPLVSRNRIYVDIIKASGGEFGRLADLVKQASRDFRDIIVTAETPAFLNALLDPQRSALDLSSPHLRTAFDADLKQFVAWLKEHTPSN